MARQLQDVFFRKAKAAGFVARSAFKLIEIQKKHRVIPPAGNVLDLGCAPGAWLQVAARCTTGAVVGVDIKGCGLPPGLDKGRVKVLQSDAQQLAASELSEEFDAVLSDMCHSTIGNAAADAARSLDLAATAAHLSLGDSLPGHRSLTVEKGVLREGGNLVIKLLEGAGTANFAADLRGSFSRLHYVRPAATRRESREVYLVGLRRQVA